MMGNTLLKIMPASQPASAWMPQSKRPEIHEWLSKSQSKSEKARLDAVGNIVVPKMAYFAANILAQMWK